MVPPIPPGSTLRLAPPFGQTLVLALALLALPWGLAEIVARTPQIQAQDTLSSVGSSDTDFDQHIAAIDNQARVLGHVDCIVLGSSMVLTGFDPHAFAAAYQQDAQANLNCVNFGVSGIVAWQMADIAQLLAQLYHPRLLILGTSARDFSDPIGDLWLATNADVTETPWVRYRLGRSFSLDGWLTDHSYAYRDWLGARQWIQATAQPPQPTAPPPFIDLTQPPDHQIEGASYDLLAHYQISPKSLAGLKQILALPQEGVQVLVVEMPVHPTYVDFFGRGEQDQDLFRATVSQAAQAQAVTFLPADPNLNLPNVDWFNRNHLDPQGALAFSQWLAAQVAQADGAGELKLAAR